MLKYLKKMGYPLHSYNSSKKYYNKTNFNDNIMINFNKKYKNKFLNIYDNNNIKDKDADILFNNSLNYILNLQHNLKNNKLNNYILGGFALKLYYLKYNKYLNDYNNPIFLTKDCDIHLVTNVETFTNDIIFNNLEKIIDSSMLCINNKNYLFLELYIVTTFKNYDEFDKLITQMLNNGYDLHLYNINKISVTYMLKFIKIINNEFCIRLTIKFIERNFNYIKLNIFKLKRTNNKLDVINCYLPVDIIFKNNVDIKLKTEIFKFDKYNYKILKMDYLLYNMILLYYGYIFKKDSPEIISRVKDKLNTRDKSRLIIFLKIYFKLKNIKNKILNNKNINKIFTILHNAYSNLKKNNFSNLFDKIKSF